jgi:hypothetical protein
MTERAESTQRQATQVAIIIAVVAAALNVAFYLLSTSYFGERAASQNLGTPAQVADQVAAARTAFAVFSAVVATAAIAATFQPRLIAVGIPFLTALVSFYAAVGTYRAGVFIVMPVTLGMVGLILLALLRGTQRGSRAAWSFLIAMCSTLAVVTLFGVTKVRAGFHVGLWYAMVVPGLLTVATVALTLLGRAFAERTR